MTNSLTGSRQACGIRAPLIRSEQAGFVGWADEEDFRTLRRGVPVLDIRARPSDVEAAVPFRFVERKDANLGCYKRAPFIVQGILVYLQVFQQTDDGSMTVYVDLATCIEKGTSPLALVTRALKSLGLKSAPRLWVHTTSEVLFWQLADPHLLALKA